MEGSAGVLVQARREAQDMRAADAPPAWWAAAWGQAERKIDAYGERMNRMFSLQPGRIAPEARPRYQCVAGPHVFHRLR